MTVIGIGLYMFLLYKEVKLFQDELGVLKLQMRQMQIITPPLSKVEAKMEAEGEVEVDADAEVNAKDEVNVEAEVNGEIIIDDDEDDVSVSSIEIKDILTNIDRREEVVVKIEKEEEIICDDTPIGSMTEEQLKLQKYDTLKEFLKANKMSYKGVRADFITRILNMQK